METHNDDIIPISMELNKYNESIKQLSIQSKDIIIAVN